MSDVMLMGRVHWNDPLAVDYLSLTIANLPLSRRVTVVCRDDRSTGDCLGPLIGTFIENRDRAAKPEVTVFGTLEDPFMPSTCINTQGR